MWEINQKFGIYIKVLLLRYNPDCNSKFYSKLKVVHQQLSKYNRYSAILGTLSQYYLYKVDRIYFMSYTHIFLSKHTTLSTENNSIPGDGNA